MRVVIDPNVLLSALIAPGGTSDQPLRAAVTRTVVVVSPRLLDRFVQRASQEHFRRWFTTTGASELADRLRDFSESVVDPEQVPAVVPDDSSDDYLVALARHAGADRLLTGDRGIQRALNDAQDVRVVSPAELLDELLHRQRRERALSQ